MYFSDWNSWGIGSFPEMEIVDPTDHILTVRATKEDFEGIANTYIRKSDER